MPSAALSVTQITKIDTGLHFAIPITPKLKNLETLKSYRANSSVEKLLYRDESKELNLSSRDLILVRMRYQFLVSKGLLVLLSNQREHISAAGCKAAKHKLALKWLFYESA